jgi:cytochrome c556
MMHRVTGVAAGLVVLALAAWAAGPAGAQNGGALTIKEIMAKLNKGKTALCPTLGSELKAEAPDWAEVQKHTREFAQLAEALGKNEPPKGSKTSWETLTKAYAGSARDLDTAAQRKDRRAALDAHKKVAGACRACHSSHRG